MSDENGFPAVSGGEKCFEYLPTDCHDCRVIKSSRLAATSRGGYPGIIQERDSAADNVALIFS